MATPYATLSELKAQPSIQGNKDDVMMQAALDAAAQVVNGFCNRKDDGFLAPGVATAREYVGTGMSHIWIDEHVQITQVEVRTSTTGAYSILPANNYRGFRGDPSRPNFNRLPNRGLILLTASSYRVWPSGVTQVDPWERQLNVPLQTSVEERLTAEPTVRVTGRWGYADTVPDLIKSATILQAARWIKRGQSFWADATTNADQSMLLYRKIIDPDLQMMLEKGRMVRPLYGG